MNLSEHFTLEELVCSQTAARKNLDNTPSDLVIANLKLLCENILEPLRTLFDCPIHIDSGYRSIAVNQAVGGSATSQHCLGKAADLIIPSLSVSEVNTKIKEAVKNGLPVDQLIREYESWNHVSFNGTQGRKDFLYITNSSHGYVHDI